MSDDPRALQLVPAAGRAGEGVEGYHQGPAAPRPGGCVLQEVSAVPLTMRCLTHGAEFGDARGACSDWSRRVYRDVLAARFGL